MKINKESFIFLTLSFLLVIILYLYLQNYKNTNIVLEIYILRSEDYINRYYNTQKNDFEIENCDNSIEEYSRIFRIFNSGIVELEYGKSNGFAKMSTDGFFVGKPQKKVFFMKTEMLKYIKDMSEYSFVGNRYYTPDNLSQLHIDSHGWLDSEDSYVVYCYKNKFYDSSYSWWSYDENGVFGPTMERFGKNTKKVDKYLAYLEGIFAYEGSAQDWIEKEDHTEIGEDIHSSPYRSS